MDIHTTELTSIFNIATDQNMPIVYLHYFDLAISFIVFFIVAALLFTAVIKFRYRDGQAEPFQNPGNHKVEVAWTLGTAAVLATLGVLTAIVMTRVIPPIGKATPDVIVNAHQFWWEYWYPKTGVVTANELYLPAGVNSLLEIRGADVVHSFWVPAFGAKMDAIPGHPNNLFLKPLRPGLFLGACSEYCGADHSLMRIIANVVPPDKFQDWTKSQLSIPVEPTDATAQQGKQLFMSKTCVQCHAISGTPAKARVGPDLTHLASRTSIGAGLLANNVDNLAHWITNPQQFKPGCYMPNMRLKPEDAHAIAAYLESLK